MKQYFSTKVNRPVYEIMAGEYVVTNDRNSVLTTLLGSCVAVCLIDRVNQVFGLNHFMLPGKFTAGQPVPTNDSRYGTCATDMLINDMMQSGAERKFLEAKLFGAGKVLDNKVYNVAKNNAEFIQQYLLKLKIPILASDLGRNYGRKILFFCDSGEVYVKKVTEFSATPEALERERQFFEWLRATL